MHVVVEINTKLPCGCFFRNVVKDESPLAKPAHYEIAAQGAARTQKRHDDVGCKAFMYPQVGSR
jgi:hypothetical protein